MSRATPEWMIRVGAVSALAIALAALTGCYWLYSCPEYLPVDYLPEVENPDLVDRSLITGEPCAPPCWQGLIPGESSTGEVLETLENTSYVDRDSIRHTTFEEHDTITWLSSAAGAASYTPNIGLIELNAGRIAYISIFLEYELILQELAQVMGEPVGYFIVEATEGHSLSCRSYVLEFIWPEDGLVAHIYYEPSEPIPRYEQLLPPGMLFVAEVRYYPPAADVMEHMMLRGVDEELYREQYAPIYQEWRGFDSVTMP